MDGGSASVEMVCAAGVRNGWALHIAHHPAIAGGAAESTRCGAPTMLSIEQKIAAQLQRSGPEVVRIVFRLGGRDVHFRDGSRIEYRWELVVSDWRCLDCGADTDAIGEYYMLHDALWERIHPLIDGNLCIGCVEHRLGRTLHAGDFPARAVNDPERLECSPRLVDRLTSTSTRPVVPR